MRAVIYFLLLLGLPSLANAAWWSEQWAYRMPITINSPVANEGDSFAGAADNLVLIKLHAGNFPDFFLIQENLADLRFIAADDKTPLKFQVDTFDLLNQLLLVWVNVPITAVGTPEKIWMYYGNSQAVAATEADSAFEVWQSAAFHFKVAEPSLVDATAYKTSASVSNVEVTPAALIGAGLKFNGEGQFVIQDTPNLQFDSAKGITFSAWLKPTALQANPLSIFSRSDANGNRMQVFADAAGISVQLINAGKTQIIQAPVVLAADTWSHFALRVDQNNLQLLINGEIVKAEAVTPIQLSGDIILGGKSDVTAGFQGDMDEVRLANTALSLRSIKLAVKNQGIADEIVSPQAPEQLGTESADGAMGLIGVIFKNMDHLGWIVLGIMGVMSLISIYVMAEKFLYLRRVMKGNDIFLNEYEKLTSVDPATLDHNVDEPASAMPIMQTELITHPYCRHSTIYHLYHRGIQEIKNRTKSIEISGLTTRATNALRATLDAQMVREVQRLNALMVLLTIAISGGPFIGLFGTVMGVMMTFAAIAKTGDVNIAAIAPGVAAALLTTLGGLFVAIPALFGYNYLTSMIKQAVADMRVFNDELVTRLAEYYGRS
jgi:biopolymer transport protein ExbB